MVALSAIQRGEALGIGVSFQTFSGFEYRLRHPFRIRNIQALGIRVQFQTFIAVECSLHVSVRCV